MKLGVVFPQTEIGSDPGGIRAYLEAVEDIGYNHVAAYDHVVGADATKRQNWSGPYNHMSPFQEPMVLFGFAAAVTKKLDLVTAVVILPQRQTVLAAKQAAAIDVLSGGRLRFGVGIGWNDVEYEALGENYHNRGRRLEEQIRVLRMLWTEPSVTFAGKYHKITAAGINPLPVQRPIPVWIGGSADAAIERVARLADGWFPAFQLNDAGRATLEKMRTFARKQGRNPKTIGIEARLSYSLGNPKAWGDQAAAWKAEGATHAMVGTTGSGLRFPDEHINAIQKMYEVIAG
ncbi:MAG: LLM class F420-dependent oxidoreductase [Dehalococcoidia bacterium]|nr:LLM class F420-dependent oxidoreductase [Dehalococcoidia bacterium]